MARLVPLVVILTVIIIIVFLAGRSRLKSDSDQTALNSGEPVNISTVETEEIPSVDDIPDMRDTLSPTVPVSGGSVFDGLDMMGPAPRVAAGGSVFDGLDMMGPAPRVNAVVGGLDVDILKQMIQSERNLDGSPKSLSDKVESVQNVNDIIDAQISAIDQDAVIAEAILIEQIAKKTAQLTELARVENARLAEAFRVQQNAYTSKMSQFQLAKEQNAAELGDLSKFVSDTRLEQIQFKNNVLNVRATSDLARLLEQKRVDALLDALDGMDDVDDERIRIEGEFADFTAQHDLLESEAIGELDDATDAIAEYELEIARVNGEIEGELQEARNLDTTFENDQSDLFGGVAQDIEGWSEIYNGEDGALNDDGLYFDPVGNVWVVVETESSQSSAISAGRASAESEKDTLEGLRNSLTDLAQSKKDADEVGLGLAKDIADARTVDTTTNAVLRVDGGERAVDQSSSESARGTIDDADRSTFETRVGVSESLYAAESATIAGGVNAQYSDASASRGGTELASMGDDRMMEICMVSANAAWGQGGQGESFMPDEACSADLLSRRDVKRATFAESYTDDPEDLDDMLDLTRPMMGCVPQSVHQSANDSRMNALGYANPGDWACGPVSDIFQLPEDDENYPLMRKNVLGVCWDVCPGQYDEGLSCVKLEDAVFEGMDDTTLDDETWLASALAAAKAQGLVRLKGTSMATRPLASPAEMEDVTEAEKWDDCLKFFKTIPVGVEPLASDAIKFNIYCDTSPNDAIPPVDCYGEWDTSDCKNPLLTIYDFGVLEDLGTKTWNVKFDPMFGGTCPYADGHTAKCVKGDKSSEARDEYEMGQGMIGGMLGL